VNPTQPTATDTTATTGWTGWTPARIAIGLALAALAVWAGLRAWSDILYIAQRDEEASQVWLVLPIFIWLAWTRRAAIAATAPRFSWLGPLLIAGGLGGSLYGFLNLNQALWHGGAVLALVGSFATVAGRPLVMRMLPALIVLAFWVPVPGMVRQQIAIPLQTASAAASEFVFTLLGLPVQRTGNILIYNGQEVAVAEACNGMRMVFALLLVAYAFAFANPLRPSVRALVLVFSPVAAVFCNVLRLVPTVILYGQSPDKWGPLFHNLAGWGMLLVAFGVLMGSVRLLQWAEVPVMNEGHVPGTPRRTPRPRSPLADDRGRGVAGGVAVVAAAALLVAGGLGFHRFPTASSAAGYHDRVLTLARAAPKTFGPWTGTAQEIPPSAIELLRPNATVSRNFVDDAGARAGQFLIVQCRDARDLAGHWPPNCYKSSGFTETGRAQTTWDAPGLPGVTGVTYRFERASLNGTLAMVVDNFLILPGVGFVPDMAAVRGAGDDPRRRHFGAAQVQVVTRPGLTEDQRRAVFAEILAPHAELLNTIAFPPGLRDDAPTAIPTTK